jgi:hypothetical protein
VDVETVDSLGRMVEDVVGAAVDSLPEEDTVLIQQIIQAAGLTCINCRDFSSVVRIHHFK